MATIKSYTDIEQSKLLANILPLESADMHYHYDNDFGELESIPTITEEDDHFVLFPKDVRCWSLAALLEVIGHYTLQTVSDSKRVIIVSENGNHIFSFSNPQPVNACYEVIIKLYELKML